MTTATPRPSARLLPTGKPLGLALLLLSGLSLLPSAPLLPSAEAGITEGLADLHNPQYGVNPRWWHRNDPIYGSKCYGSPYFQSRRFEYDRYRYVKTPPCYPKAPPSSGPQNFDPDYYTGRCCLYHNRIYPGYGSGYRGGVHYRRGAVAPPGDDWVHESDRRDAWAD